MFAAPIYTTRVLIIKNLHALNIVNNVNENVEKIMVNKQVPT